MPPQPFQEGNFCFCNIWKTRANFCKELLVLDYSIYTHQKSLQSKVAIPLYENSLRVDDHSFFSPDSLPGQTSRMPSRSRIAKFKIELCLKFQGKQNPHKWKAPHPHPEKFARGYWVMSTHTHWHTVTCPKYLDVRLWWREQVRKNQTKEEWFSFWWYIFILITSFYANGSYVKVDSLSKLFVNNEMGIFEILFQINQQFVVAGETRWVSFWVNLLWGHLHTYTHALPPQFSKQNLCIYLNRYIPHFVCYYIYIYIHIASWILCLEQNHEVRKVHDECNVGSVYSHLSESSIKFQTKYIGAVESITVPFFLKGVLYIKRTSHVSISVSTRTTLER